MSGLEKLFVCRQRFPKDKTRFLVLRWSGEHLIGVMDPIDSEDELSYELRMIMLKLGESWGVHFKVPCDVAMVSGELCWLVPLSPPERNGIIMKIIDRS